MLTFNLQNIRKAKEEIARLDEEATAAATKTNGSAKEANAVNGAAPVTEKKVAADAPVEA